jgi:hypothetical protein
MRWEDTQLRKYIEKNQLSRWAKAAWEAAKREVTEELDIVTASGANGGPVVPVKVNGQGNGHVVESVEADED